MSASWFDRSPQAIAESLRDLLASMLRSDAVYVQLRDPGSGQFVVAAVGTVPSAGEAGQVLAVPVGLEWATGRLVVGWQRAEPPNELEKILLKVAANHAAIALQQAALLLRHEEAERLQSVHAAQQAAVAQLGLRVVTGLPIGQTLEEALQVVYSTLRLDCCELLELAANGQSLLLTAGVGWDPAVVGHARISSGRGSQAGYAISVGDPVIIHDLALETRFAPSPLLSERGVVSGVSVLVHDQHRLFGVLSGHTCQPRTFTTNDVQFLQSIANLLAAAIQRDRSEREREGLLRQTQRAVAARDRAVGVVSHDLGNPLSTILICATALLDPEPPSAQGTRQMAQIIQRSGAWMQQIVQDLLDRASLDAGRLKLDRRPIAAADVITVAQDMFIPLAQEQAVQFFVRCPADLPRIDADPKRLLQVLSNLLSNAMKFTQPGGQVVLSAGEYPAPVEQGGGAIRFTVSDTGLGIAPEDLSHICDWFWHVRRVGQRGTGLGLAIAKDLVEAHGGNLNVESAIGSGSSFWFTMPVVEGEA
jgi:signal transduction histidine kinase